MVRLDGLSLQDPGGQPLLAADEARITLDALDILRHWRLAVTIGSRAPVIHLQRDRQGQFSLGGRLPERSGDTAAGLPFILSGLTIENGRLEFQDRMRGTPVTTRFQTLSATVGNLGADPAFATPFRLSAEGPKDELLSLEGTVLLLASENRCRAGCRTPAPVVLGGECRRRILTGTSARAC